MAALLADIDRDAHGLVAVVFDGVDLAATHDHRLPIALRGIGFALRRPPLRRPGEHILDDVA